MLLNSYRFATASSSGVIPEPLHWWDLDSTSYNDQGIGAWPDLTAVGTPTVSGGTGPGGQDVINLDRGDWLTTSQAWDGGKSEMTVSLWAYMDTHDTTGTMLLSWRALVVDILTLFFIQPTANKVRIYDLSFDSAAVDYASGNSLGAWYHFAYTWDGATLRYYRDGALLATDTPGGVDAFSGGLMELFLGSYDQFNNDYDMDGRLAMVGLWDTALTLAQISHLYNSGAGRQHAELDIATATVSQPLHWWDLDDDGAWADQGSGAWAGLTESGTVTVASGAGPGGQDVASFDRGDWLDAGSKAWDGGVDQMTFAGWFNIDSYDTGGIILPAWRQGATLFNQVLVTNTGEIKAYIWDSAGDLSLITKTGISLSSWHHFAITWDGETHRLFIDGEFIVASNPGNIDAFPTANITLNLGSYNNSGTNFLFDGKMAMVGIWDKALTAAQISEQLYNSGTGKQYADLDIL